MQINDPLIQKGTIKAFNISLFTATLCLCWRFCFGIHVDTLANEFLVV